MKVRADTSKGSFKLQLAEKVLSFRGRNLLLLSWTGEQRVSTETSHQASHFPIYEAKSIQLENVGRQHFAGSGYFLRFACDALDCWSLQL